MGNMNIGKLFKSVVLCYGSGDITKTKDNKKLKYLSYCLLNIDNSKIK